MKSTTFNIPHFLGIADLADLVNGLSITLTSSDKNFDYTEAYLLLPEITNVFYQSIGVKPYELKNHTNPPNTKNIETTLIMGQLVSAYSIAPNHNQSKFHIHGFIYGLSNYSKGINEWITFVESKLRELKPISRKNRYSIVMKPITDPIDKVVRRSSYQSLVEYLTNPEYETFLHYLIHRNSKQLLYHYV